MSKSKQGIQISYKHVVEEMKELTVSEDLFKVLPGKSLTNQKNRVAVISFGSKGNDIYVDELKASVGFDLHVTNETTRIGYSYIRINGREIGNLNRFGKVEAHTTKYDANGNVFVTDIMGHIRRENVERADSVINFVVAVMKTALERLDVVKTQNPDLFAVDATITQTDINKGNKYVGDTNIGIPL